MDISQTTMMMMGLLDYFDAIAVFVTVSTVLYATLRKLTERAQLLAVACAQTQKFYADVDNLFREPDLPDDLKSVLYDLLFAVTDDRKGRIAFKAIVGRPRNPKPVANNWLADAVADLRKKDPELSNRFIDALRVGLSSLLATYATSIGRGPVEIVKTTNDQSELTRAAQRMERKFKEQSFLLGSPAHA